MHESDCGLVGLDRDVAFVIGGDFNIVPAALDCWQGAAADGSIFCTTEERSRYRSLLDLKLTDLFRHVHPEEQKFSWWDYRGGALTNLLIARGAQDTRQAALERESIKHAGDRQPTERAGRHNGHRFGGRVIDDRQALHHPDMPGFFGPLITGE